MAKKAYVVKRSMSYSGANIEVVLYTRNSVYAEWYVKQHSSVSDYTYWVMEYIPPKFVTQEEEKSPLEFTYTFEISSREITDVEAGFLENEWEPEDDYITIPVRGITAKHCHINARRKFNQLFPFSKHNER